MRRRTIVRLGAPSTARAPALVVPCPPAIPHSVAAAVRSCPRRRRVRAACATCFACSAPPQRRPARLRRCWRWRSRRRGRGRRQRWRRRQRRRRRWRNRRVVRDATRVDSTVQVQLSCCPPKPEPVSHRLRHRPQRGAPTSRTCGSDRWTWEWACAARRRAAAAEGSRGDSLSRRTR